MKLLELLCLETISGSIVGIEGVTLLYVAEFPCKGVIGVDVTDDSGWKGGN